MAGHVWAVHYEGGSLSFTPLDFQVADLQTLAQNDYTALLNIQTGGMKTSLTTFAIRDSGASRVLISAPAQTMRSAWVPTVADILGVEAREIGNRTKAMQSALADFELGLSGVYMVTPQLLARKSTDKSMWAGDMLVLDESHELMSPGKTGQRAISGYTYKESGESLARFFGARMALSGTAFRNKFEYAWSYGRFLWWWLDARDELAYHNHYQWKQDRMTSHAVYRKNPRTGEAEAVKVFDLEKDSGKWINEAPCAITHLKRERCCKFHPRGFMPLNEPVIQHETIPLLPAQKKAIKELEDMAVTWLDEHPLVSELPITTATRIRQVTLGVPTLIPVGDGDYEVTFADDCPSPAIDWLLELLEWEIEGETCLVWTDSQKFASVVTKRLNSAGVKAFEYSGATRKDRDDNAARFGSEFRVMVGVIAAGGTGLDGLQRVCNNSVYLNRSLDETLNEQSDGRDDRPGQERQVMRWFLHDDLGLSEGRFNEAIEKRLQLRKSLRRGV